MRVVLYTHEFEPITVLTLKPWAVEHLRHHRMVSLQVIPQMPLPPPAQPGEPLPETTFTLYAVHITADILHRNGLEHLLLFTHDEVSAMLLESAFLPGQWKELRERENNAFAEGFLLAIDKLGQ